MYSIFVALNYLVMNYCLFVIAVSAVRGEISIGTLFNYKASTKR
jgi:hypothetical protein